MRVHNVIRLPSVVLIVNKQSKVRGVFSPKWNHSQTKPGFIASVS